MQPELSTARLHLRPWRLDDLEFCVAMNMDPEVGRYLFPHGPPVEAEQRRAWRERITSGWPRQGGIWAVEWAGKGTMLGWCGLFPLEDSGLIEIGYRYITAAWGQGVATEAAVEVLDHGFGEFAFDPIVAVTHPDNTGSQKVLRKIGLRPGGLRFQYGMDLSFFSLNRGDYLISR
ncbi:MAG: GNAT family N-acetyltransferase [Alphaproteobacteria bacterium]|nr:GNAT family N-acetyltransferase [Alphaproteobacteria bacterium]